MATNVPLRALRDVARFGLACLAGALAACDSGHARSHADAAAAEDAGTGSTNDAATERDASAADDANASDANASDGASDTPDSATDAPVPAQPSARCGTASTLYPPGTTAGQITSGGAMRTFRVHVPPAYNPATPLPLVLMFHGGGGSGRQFEEASSGMDTVADRENFIAVYPDGSGTIKTWNGVGCCGYAVTNDVDDVGFARALLDHLEGALCLDRSRIYASGMSNGAILSQRLACELSERLAAIAPVAGTNLTTTCTPTRPIAVLEIHGSADGHVPFDGGQGCGTGDVNFTSVPNTIAGWRMRNGCSDSTSTYLDQGDGHCDRYARCSEDVVLCVIAGGGHNWPGGEPPADLIPCPGNGFQSTTFHASEVVWSFFAQHALAP